MKNENQYLEELAGVVVERAEELLLDDVTNAQAAHILGDIVELYTEQPTIFPTDLRSLRSDLNAVKMWQPELGEKTDKFLADIVGMYCAKNNPGTA